MSILVNGVEIADGAVLAEMQHHPAASMKEARRQAAEALVVRELLLQEARRLDIAAPDEAGAADGDETPEERTIRLLLERAVRVPEPDEETCRRYWANNRRRFGTPDLFEAQHILCAAPPDDEEARAAARQRALELLAQVLADPARLPELAGAFSDCPSKATGGSLGQVTRGSTIPEFETFLFSLDEGEVCAAPVETRYGFHVVRLIRRIAGNDLPFELVHARVADHLRDSVWTRAVSQYIQLLAGRATIEGIELQNAASTPLVQ